MLEPNEMKKMLMILQNLKNNVPVHSKCVILNNNYVRSSDGPHYDDDGKFYLPDSDKFDLMIYISDVIFHEVHELKDSFDEKLDSLDKKMAVIDEKVDAQGNFIMSDKVQYSRNMNFSG